MGYHLATIRTPKKSKGPGIGETMQGSDGPSSSFIDSDTWLCPFHAFLFPLSFCPAFLLCLFPLDSFRILLGIHLNTTSAGKRSLTSPDQVRAPALCGQSTLYFCVIVCLSLVPFVGTQTDN